MPLTQPDEVIVIKQNPAAGRDLALFRESA